MSDAEELSALRRKYAVSFEDEINKQLKELGMPSAKFNVSFDENDGKTAVDVTSNGFDKVEFLISANKGEPLKPLQKIISGGEMSRFMLALKNITARLDGIDTMVFDEIDTGISGYIAQVVAEKLYNISVSRQVIAVTHLPQLASMADNHYKIEKKKPPTRRLRTLKSWTTKGNFKKSQGLSAAAHTASTHCRTRSK